jgi:NADP-dependent alcohol dehydrogenase
MNNFEFYNPTKIIFGKDQMSRLAEEIPTNAKVLVLYGGGSVKKYGTYEKVMEALKGYNVTEFSGIPTNPEYEVLLDALTVIKEKKIDFLLAVGGGSVIDGTKFLSSAALYKGDSPWDILKNAIKTFEGLPFGTILTLPATGSEMNSGAVVTRRETGEKLGMGGPGLFPKFSILDPQVVATLPKRQIANGIADAFTHVMEQYLTFPAGGHLQDRLAESILQTLIEVAPKVLENPKDYTAASNFMWSCTMALNGLIQKGVPTDWAIHAMGHELTALYGIDHARTLAILASSHYTYNLDSKKEKLAQYGRRVWNIEGNEDSEVALKAIEKTDDFFHSLGIDTKLSLYTDKAKQTPSLIANALEQRGWVAIGEHKSLTPKDVEKIVEMSI